MDDSAEDCFWSEPSEGWFFSKASETKGPFDGFAEAVAAYNEEAPRNPLIYDPDARG